jgi:sulfotransferase family protein
MSRADSPLRERMIFNVGARRSGTFWLQRVVCAHPEIAAVPSETHLFYGVANLMEHLHHGARSSPQVGAVYVERDAALDSVRDLCDTIFAPYLEPGARYVAERTPLHALKLDLIRDVYPDARVIHIIRDGRDAARSLAAQDFGPAQIAGAAQEWREVIEAARTAGIPEDRYLEVRYEDLLTSPETVVGTVYEWLGLPATDEIVAHSVAESRAKANVDRFEVSGVASGKWEETFTAEDQVAFEEEAGELLAELGYVAGSARGKARDRPAARRQHGRGAARRTLRRLRGANGEEEERRSRIAHRQTVADRWLERLRGGDVAGARELQNPDARVTVIDASGRREARGEEAARLLADVIASDSALRAPQSRGDVHPSLPTIAYVLSLAVDGSTEERVLFVTVPGEQITDVTIYRLPLSPR